MKLAFICPSLKNTEEDLDLLKSFFQFLTFGQAPQSTTFQSLSQPYFEQTFFDLHSGFGRNAWQERLRKSPQNEIYSTEAFSGLKSALQLYDTLNLEKQNHSYFNNLQPETLLIEEIENIWKDIDERDDWSKFQDKLKAIRSFRGVFSLK